MVKKHSLETGKPQMVRLIDEVAYWIALIAGIIGNFFVSVMLVPFLIIINDIQLFFAMPLVGLGTGYIFYYILKGIRHLEKQHHIIIWLLLPSIALINVYIITQLSNLLAVLLQIESGVHDPLITSLLYSAFFVLPYLIGKLMKK